MARDGLTNFMIKLAHRDSVDAHPVRVGHRWRRRIAITARREPGIKETEMNAFFKDMLMGEGETAEEAMANAIAEARHADIIDDDAETDEDAYPRVTFETFWNELKVS